jgi:hypothetical protein
MARLQKCPCGSGEYPEAQYDARGIFLCYTCDQCKDKKLAGYRPDVLTDPNYWHDEPIDEDE